MLTEVLCSFNHSTDITWVSIICCTVEHEQVVCLGYKTSNRDTCDLQVTGAFSEAAWSDLTEDAELGDCPSSSLEKKPQIGTTVN